MEAIPQADAVAVGQYDFEQLPENPEDVEDFPEPLVLRVKAREGVADSFSASRRIVGRALREQNSVLHIW